MAARYAGLASPTIAIASPSAGQPYAIGERATVSWFYTGISKKKKLRIALRNANGKSVRKVRIRADRSYTFQISPALATKLSQVEVCIPRSARFPKICDTRNVTVLGNSPQAPGQPAGIRFNPESLGFVTLKDADPPSQVLELSPSGSQTTGFSVENSASWLSIGPSGGSVPAAVTLSAHVAGLAPGIYKTVLKVTATGNGAVSNIPVSLEVMKPAAKAPGSLKFSATRLGIDITSGAAPESRSLNLLTSDGAAVPFQASSNAGWLRVTPNSGTTPANLTVSANAAGLAAGSYSGEVTATADGYDLVKIPVTLNVAPPLVPALQFNTSGADFSAPSGQSPAVQTLQLSTNTGAPAALVLDESAPWLTVLSGGASTPSAITLAVNGAGLAPGSYSTTLTAQASGFQPVAIPVRFNVTAPAAAQFFDDFNDGNANGWSVLNETDNPANWQVQGGAYTQSETVGLGSEAYRQGYAIGALSVLDDSLGLQDYQYEATITPTSEFNVDAGVLFRYRDISNYYRVSLGNGYTRLERKLNNAFATLASNARGYVRGVPQVVSVSVQGNLIQVSINGERLFSVRDDSFSSGGIGLYSRGTSAFDNVQVRSLAGTPSITVSKPEAHTLVTQTSFGVSAVVLNHPGPSAGVEFNLAGIPGACGQAVESAPGLFTAQCSIPGDGTVSGVLASLKVGGAIVDLDSSERVAYGNKILAIGDSITFGLGDDNAQDDQEPGGWVISNGYSPVLTNLLNQNGGLPGMVLNNAIPGVRSNDMAFVHLQGILDRHKDAQYVLLGIGTNDAITNVTAATYLKNMNRMIQTIRTAGKTPIIPLIPKLFADPAKDALIGGSGGYNSGIPGLSGVTLGPDFYGAFQNRQELFPDLIHPNGIGYQIMGDLWNQSLGFIQ